MLVSAKMLRMSSSTTSAFLPLRVGSVRMQLVEQPLLLGRQRAFHPVQEQRGFVEQALGRLHVLDDNRLRQLPELRFSAFDSSLPV